MYNARQAVCLFSVLTSSFFSPETLAGLVIANARIKGKLDVQRETGGIE